MSIELVPNRDFLILQINRISDLGLNSPVLQELDSLLKLFDEWMPSINSLDLGKSEEEVKRLLCTHLCLAVLIDVQAKKLNNNEVNLAEQLKVWWAWMTHWNITHLRQEILTEAYQLMTASTTQKIENKPAPKSGLSVKEGGKQKVAPTSSAIEPVTSGQLVVHNLTEESFVKGSLIAEAYSCSGQIEFLPNESTDHGLRHDRLRFKKPSGMTFAACQKVIPEILSNAGIDPEIEVLFRRLPHNKFDLHIPRPRSEWKELSYKDFLWSGKPEGENLGEYLVRRFYIPPNSPPRVPIGVNLDMEEVFVDFSTGIFVTGKPNRGKSELIKSILMTLSIGFEPNQLWWVGADWKDGALLDKFSSLPSCVHPIAKSEQEAKDLMKWLKAQNRRREKLIDKYKKHGVENICHYNSLPDEEPMPWLILFWEELARGRQVLGESQDEFLNSVCNFWRYLGIIPVASTQYPSQTMSGSGPGARAAYGTKITFESPEAGRLLFGEGSTYAKYADALDGPGDCLVVGNDGFNRCQTFLIEPAIMMQVIDTISRRDGDYVRPILALPDSEEQEAVVKADPSSPGSSTEDESEPAELLEDEEIQDINQRCIDYLRLKEIDLNRERAGKDKLPQLHYLAQLVGDFYYPKDDPRRGNYQGWVEDLSDLDPDDPRRKANNGKNLGRSKTRLNQIIRRASEFQQSQPLAS